MSAPDETAARAGLAQRRRWRLDDYERADAALTKRLGNGHFHGSDAVIRAAVELLEAALAELEER